MTARSSIELAGAPTSHRNTEERTLSCADLFAGAGGLSSGLSEGGIELIWAGEADSAAHATYSQSVGKHARLVSISDSTEIPQCDIVVGGPPCQGFSSAGARDSHDARNSLVRVFANLVGRTRPRMVVFENVEGFLTADGGGRVLDLLTPLIEAGYFLRLRKINLANYGVPQNRKRVVLLGGLGFDPGFPEMTHRARGIPGADKLARHLPDTPSIEEVFADLGPPGDAPPGDPTLHYTYPLSAELAARVVSLEQGKTMKDLPETMWHSSYKRRAFRRVMDGTPTERRGGAPAGIRRLVASEPSKAITSGATREFIHPTEPRFLTLRECARLQTFPDSFAFTGNAAAVALQIGNAIPPAFGRVLAGHLRRRLNDLMPKHCQGRLLELSLTHSSGKSPALIQTEQAVLGLMETTAPERQAELWD